MVLGCSTPKKGCDDPSAVNYSFDADEPCSKNISEGDCPCIYPNLLITPVFAFTMPTSSGDSSVVWKENTILIDDFGQNFLLKRFSFYLSDIRLENSAGNWISITDSISIPIKSTNADSNTVFIKNNLTLIGQNSTSNTVGTFPHSGKFRRLSFTFGLKSPENQANIRNIKMPTHPLNTDSMYLKNEYRLISGKFYIQTSVNITRIIPLKENKNIILTIPAEVIFKSATDNALSLVFDYKRIFTAIDFKVDSDTTIERKIFENCSSAFQINQ